MADLSRFSIEALETFAAIVAADGNATAAADKLGVGQPAVSKRLAALRAATAERGRESWLVLHGKRWRLSPEGERVRGVVQDLVRRYREMEEFAATPAEEAPPLAVACGRHAAAGFVLRAVGELLKKKPDARVRLATPRGKARIEGVAGGQYEFAVVGETPEEIAQIARGELFVETLFENRFVLAACPPAKAAWGKAWKGLPAGAAVGAAAAADLPLVLPEADAARRRQLDEAAKRATGRPWRAAVEVGGWEVVLAFVRAGVGVGVVPRDAVKAASLPGGDAAVRELNPAEFPPSPVRLVTRKAHGRHEPELSPTAAELAQLVRREAADLGK